MTFIDSTRVAARPPASAREQRALAWVRSYLDAHNRHDAEAAVAHYAPDAVFVLSDGRGDVRGTAAIAELERLDVALGSWVEPIGLQARTSGGSVIVSFLHVIEQSSIADAIGVPLIVAEPVETGFVVRGDRLLRVVQPSFAAACGRAMRAGFMGFIAWLRERNDSRSATLLRPDGSIVLTATTAPVWINGIREWRGASGWAPSQQDVLECARR